MNKKVFWVLFCLILLFGLILRLYPAQNHNFYFTVDQADDAVWVREVLVRHQLLWHGTRTNIPDVFSGPLWYYFLLPGFFIFNGDPFGGVFMLILLNVALTAVLILFFTKRIGKEKALLLGFSLQFFWWFFDTSRWAFNPHPLVVVAILTILFFIKVLEGDKKSYLWAAFLVFFSFNLEIAGASAICLFYLLFGVWALFKKRLNFKSVLIPFTFVGLALLFVMLQLAKALSRERLPGSPTGYFGGINIAHITPEFLRAFSYSLLPYHLFFSLVLLGIIIFLYWKGKTNKTTTRFLILTFILWLVDWTFFSTNRGWFEWHTYYLPTVLFVAVLLLVFSLKRKIAFLVYLLIMVSELSVFGPRYIQYLRSFSDPGILASQLQVLDWIYANREGDGFNAYTYMPARRDYPYQYTFWWYGRKKYGFVPCEYSIYVHGLKLYVPGRLFYTKPTLGCDHFRFLIIDKSLDMVAYDEWYSQVSQGTRKVDETVIDGTTIEKRVLTN